MLDIILASGSPRRADLLRQIGIDFKIFTSNTDETFDPSSAPENIAVDLSSRKASAVFEEILPETNTAIIAADTIVVHKSKVLGKPKDRDDAVAMLRELSNDVHQVYTGVTIFYYVDNKINVENFCEKVDVYFNEMTDDEIKKYVDTWEPLDKAGSYGIQGKGAVFIRKIDGDYYSVVGLPLSRVYNSLKQYM